MGFLDAIRAVFSGSTRTTAPPGPEAYVPLLPSGRGFVLAISGEGHYQPALAALTADGTDEMVVMLKSDPTNAYDKNAVMVLAMDGSKLGYLSREDAPRYRQSIVFVESKGSTATCRAKVFGGTKQKPSRGVWLDLAAPTNVATEFGLKYSRVRSE